MIRDRLDFLTLVLIMRKPPAPPAPTVTVPNLSIRINLGKNARIGPGKIALLEEVEKNGSISGGGRALKMSYRRAWELIEEMNQTLGIAVVETVTGGAGGGGARLTDAGREIISEYRELEERAAEVARRHLSRLLEVCKPT
jgi:molybdate transport system regulatory protein